MTGRAAALALAAVLALPARAPCAGAARRRAGTEASRGPGREARPARRAAGGGSRRAGEAQG